MADKLGMWSVTLGACVLLAGCQQSSGSRFASQNRAQPIMAKQNQAPKPAFPHNNSTANPAGGGSTAGSTAGSNANLGKFTTSTPPSGLSTNKTAGAVTTTGAAGNAFPQAPLPPSGPSTTTNRTNTVTTTTPDFMPPMPTGGNLPPLPASANVPAAAAPNNLPMLPPLPNDKGLSQPGIIPLP